MDKKAKGWRVRLPIINDQAQLPLKRPPPAHHRCLARERILQERPPVDNKGDWRAATTHNGSAALAIIAGRGVRGSKQPELHRQSGSIRNYVHGTMQSEAVESSEDPPAERRKKVPRKNERGAAMGKRGWPRTGPRAATRRGDQAPGAQDSCGPSTSDCPRTEQKGQTAQHVHARPQTRSINRQLPDKSGRKPTAGAQLVARPRDRAWQEKPWEPTGRTCPTVLPRSSVCPLPRHKEH